MDPQTLETTTPSARVSVSGSKFHVTLAVRLADEDYVGGNVMRFPRTARVAVEPGDVMARGYTRMNWASGLASGAFYAFRTLDATRQYVEVIEFSGRLRSVDMGAVAYAAAVAVCRLVGHDCPEAAAEGWTVSEGLTPNASTVAAAAANGTSHADAALAGS